MSIALKKAFHRPAQHGMSSQSHHAPNHHHHHHNHRSSAASTAHSVAVSAARRAPRDIGMLMLLLAAETVVSVAQQQQHHNIAPNRFYRQGHDAFNAADSSTSFSLMATEMIATAMNAPSASGTSPTTANATNVVFTAQKKNKSENAKIAPPSPISHDGETDADDITTIVTGTEVSSAGHHTDVDDYDVEEPENNNDATVAALSGAAFSWVIGNREVGGGLPQSATPTSRGRAAASSVSISLDNNIKTLLAASTAASISGSHHAPSSSSSASASATRTSSNGTGSDSGSVTLRSGDALDVSFMRVVNASSSSSSSSSSFLFASTNTNIVLNAIFSYLSWRDAVNVRAVSRPLFLHSLNCVSIMRMPLSGTPAIFIPYPSNTNSINNNKQNHQQHNNGCTLPSAVDSSSSSSPAPQQHHESLHWTSQSSQWRCAACGANNNPTRTTCTWYNCGAVNPSLWNSQRLFIGQLRRDGTIPFVLWVLKDVLGINGADIKTIENHRDKVTGRGKGCAWVTVSANASSSSSVFPVIPSCVDVAPSSVNTNADKLLALHHRAFFDTVHGVEGLWLTSMSLAKDLDLEGSLRQGGGAASKSSVAAHPALPPQHPRHMPRSSVVVEATNPHQGLPTDFIGRVRNFPIHYVYERAVSTAEEKNSGSSPTMNTGKVRFVHNPYFSHTSFASGSASAAVKRNNGQQQQQTAARVAPASTFDNNRQRQWASPSAPSAVSVSA